MKAVFVFAAAAFMSVASVAAHATTSETLTLKSQSSGVGCFKNAKDRRYHQVTLETGVTLSAGTKKGSYRFLSKCTYDLPADGLTRFCAKRSNGKYYPTLIESGRILTSTAPEAGFKRQTDCHRSLD